MAQTTVGAALRAARKDTGMTEGEAADRADVERGWLNSVELGRIVKPDQERIKRLARLYGVHPHVFLKLAGYDVDEASMPVRRESDLLLELWARARQREKDQDPKAHHDLEAVSRAVGRQLGQLVTA